MISSCIGGPKSCYCFDSTDSFCFLLARHFDQNGFELAKYTYLVLTIVVNLINPE